MTEAITSRRYTTESTLNQGRRNIFLGLVINAALWGTAFLYLIFAKLH